MAESSTATFTDTDFAYCGGTYSSDGVGAGIYSVSSVLNMHGGSFTSCLGTNSGHGAGLYLSASTATINDISFSSCSTAGNGGSVYATTSELTLTHFDVSFGSASAGGGMFLDESTVDLKNGTFKNNQADHYGGGLSMWASTLTTTDLTFTSNSACYGDGGGLYFDSTSGTNYINNVRFSANSGYTQQGEAVTASDVLVYNYNSGKISCNAGCGSKGMYKSGCTEVSSLSYNSETTCNSRFERAPRTVPLNITPRAPTSALPHRRLTPPLPISPTPPSLLPQLL